MELGGGARSRPGDRPGESQIPGGRPEVPGGVATNSNAGNPINNGVKMVEIFESGDKLSDETIKLFESFLEINLPKSYK